ncbi:hypothetical protein L198_06123 [Cryptococcus wingfieldii CBS 7118]|uniref:Uncharacterized protein n=1 Tax=Cryptococcus wingfieldii CBS 7118 TaxID=1295528 RepID=A0A1E3ISB3_9TREE|nr:hypothetical protein L198_06123 [Cryptococcus wingfieldii CBS 7118]ODN90806.1 hypothetical protein L198_06123 [Cryptococcus wingfieldii CBS 7118]
MASKDLFKPQWSTSLSLSSTNKPLIITSCTLVTGIPNSHEWSPSLVPPMAASERLTLFLSSAGIHVVQVYKLTLETIHLKGGDILHASHESGVLFSTVASTVAKRLNIKAKSITKQEAEEAYTWGVQMMMMDCRTSSELTRAWLGWKPEGVGFGWYFGDDCVYRG